MLYLAEASAWIDDRLAAAGVSRSGPLVSVRVRPWAEVARAETDRGPVWLKAAAGATAFEPALYALLAERVPEMILEPLGIDAERGWVLLPDGGRPIAETARGERQIAALVAALARYARLQRCLAADERALLDLGIADMRPAAMPARFEQALAAAARYADDRGDERDRASLERVREFGPRFRELCERLAARPEGGGLDHNDLHPWNILGDAGRPRGLRFYDWGDSVVAHPFAAMLVPQIYAARRLPGARERLRDAYLAEWSDRAPRAELLETLELACAVAKVARALTWERALLAGGPSDEMDAEFARAPLASLESLVDGSYDGGA